MNGKELARLLAPPLLAQLVRQFRAKPTIVEWEYMPDGWQAEQANPAIKGWNERSVLESYVARWPAFVESLNGTTPFGASPEGVSPVRFDLVFHNTLMSYAYALALTARNKMEISMLDWGGGLGHYYLISRALLPDLKVHYHCKDVPVLAEYGQSLFAQAHFYVDDTCLKRSYDFVLASTSLHYSKDWTSILTGLAQATSGQLFVTRLPIVKAAASFVFVQRPYQYGYDTEYLGWCLNRAQFLECAGAAGLELVREFVTGERPSIQGAPEQCQYRGYLFRPNTVGQREPAKPG
jgi:putative methyltransferase (TIGR04325 family)